MYYLNSDIESHAAPAAGRQRREGVKNEREKEPVVAKVLKTFHQFGEFSFAEISKNDDEFSFQSSQKKLVSG
jgi:hypothetical protein